MIIAAFVWLANAGDPPTGRTGAPFDGNCNNCHNNPTSSYAGNVVLEDLPATVMPGAVYPITIRLTTTGGNPITGGYQVVVVDNANNNSGNLANLNAQSGTQFAGGREYVEHRGDQTFAGGECAWTFNWTAPTSASGNNIKFYYIGNFTNNDMNSGGDLAVWNTVSVPFDGGVPLDVNITEVVNVRCFGGNTGFIDIEASGGNGTYTYLWSNNQTTKAAMNLVAGTYTVTVTSNGNMATAMATITQPPALTGSITGGGQITCANTSVTLTANASGGAGPYFYVWSNGAQGNPIEATEAGTYTVTISDNNDCTKTATTTVTSNLSAPTATAGPDKVLTCTITSIALNGTGSSTGASITYLWTTTNGNIVSGVNTLTPVVNQCGTYTLTVTNEQNGCTASDVAVVTCEVNPPGATATGGTITCVAPSVVLMGASPTSGVTFQWAGPNNFTSNLQNPTVSASGTYTLTVTNPSNSCKSTATATVTTNTTQPNASAIGGGITCSAPTVTLFGNSTTNNVTYTWSGPGITPNNMNLQNPIVSACGSYTLVVTANNNGCTNTATAIVTCDQVTPNISITPSSVEITCTNPSPQICAGSSTTNIAIAWTGPNGFTANTSCINASNPGIYTAIVTNLANGCTSTAPVTVTLNITAPTANIAPPTNLNCANPCIMLNASASSQGSLFTYIWTTNNGSITGGGTTLTPTVCSAGTYTLLVTNTSNGCTATATTTVSQSPTLTATLSTQPVACNGGANGSATVTGTGGLPGYQYVWSNGASTNSITGLSAGTYLVTVTDAEACTATGSAVVVQPPVLAANASATGQTGFGINDGTATASPSGGTSPYSYVWNNTATTSGITNLSPGTYTVTVADNNNCSAVQTVTVNSFGCNVSATLAVTNVACNGAASGSINLTVQGANNPVAYIWSNGTTTEDIGNLLAGTYTVSITDASGCPLTLNTTVSQPTALAPNATATGETTIGGNNGTATAAPTGGVSPYSYLWYTGATTAGITGLTTGSYTVTVADANACTAVQSVSVSSFNCQLSVTLSSVNPTCFGLTNGTATAMPVGGTPAFQYLWNTGATTSTVANLGAGSYTATITDAAGCIATGMTTLQQPAILDAIISNIVNVPCLESPTGSATLSIEGGIAPYTWTGPSLLNNLTAGSYTITVTDAQGCMDQVSFSIMSTDVTPPQINCPPSIALCGANIVDYPNPTVSDNCNLNTTAILISGQASGTAFDDGVTTQVFQVTDATGNTASCSFSVTVYGIPDATFISTNDQNSAGVGSIDVTAIGNAPFSYSWTKNGAFFANTQDLTNLFAGSYSLVLTDVNGCQTQLAPITIDNLVGTIEPEKVASVRVFPNPSWGKLQLETVYFEPIRGHLFNSQGRLIRIFESNELSGEMDISMFPSGMYYLKLEDKNAASKGVMLVLE